eukprot:m51a1_g8734 hypothetical protein (248) ;mRNA; r:16643-17574
MLLATPDPAKPRRAGLADALSDDDDDAPLAGPSAAALCRPRPPLAPPQLLAPRRRGPVEVTRASAAAAGEWARAGVAEAIREEIEAAACAPLVPAQAADLQLVSPPKSSARESKENREKRLAELEARALEARLGCEAERSVALALTSELLECGASSAAAEGTGTRGPEEFRRASEEELRGVQLALAERASLFLDPSSDEDDKDQGHLAMSEEDGDGWQTGDEYEDDDAAVDAQRHPADDADSTPCDT